MCFLFFVLTIIPHGGSVGHYLDGLGEVQPKPLVIDKRGTIGAVISLMFNDPAKRTHVWVINKHGRVKSVVSLVEIARALHIRMHSDEGEFVE